MQDVTVIKMFATWCGPCRRYNHTFYRVTDRLGVKTQDINIEEQPEIAKEYNVTSIPTTIILKGDQIVGRAQGAMTEAMLETLIQEKTAC